MTNDKRPEFSDDTPPLSKAAMAQAMRLLPQHDFTASQTSERFEAYIASERPPEIATRIEPVGEGRNRRWRVAVDIMGERVSSLARPPLEAIQVDRRDFEPSDARRLEPSIPSLLSRVSTSPKATRRPKPFEIGMGDRRWSPTTIFMPDGRRPYYDTNYPWRCVVRLTRPSGWCGSGVLIGPRHVLTASHCIDWTPGWLNVDVLFANNASLGSTGAFRAYAETKVGPGGISPGDKDEDYAVVVLNERLGDRFGWMGCRTYNSSWDDEVSAWYSVGYPQDISSTGQTPCWQTNFFLNEVAFDFGSARLLESNTFDNWPGQSGSPIFGFWDDGPYVVGVVSGENSSNNNISGGSLLTSIVSRARRENP